MSSLVLCGCRTAVGGFLPGEGCGPSPCAFAAGGLGWGWRSGPEWGSDWVRAAEAEEVVVVEVEVEKEQEQVQERAARYWPPPLPQPPPPFGPPPRAAGSAAV